MNRMILAALAASLMASVAFAQGGKVAGKKAPVTGKCPMCAKAKKECADCKKMKGECAKCKAMEGKMGKTRPHGKQ